MSERIEAVGPASVPVSTRRPPPSLEATAPGLTPSQVQEHRDYHARAQGDVQALRRMDLPFLAGPGSVQASEAFRAVGLWDSAKSRRQDGRLVVSDLLHSAEVWDEAGVTRVTGESQLLGGGVRRVDGRLYEGKEVTTIRTFASADDAEPTIHQNFTRSAEGDTVRRTFYRRGETGSATVRGGFDHSAGTSDVRLSYDEEDLREDRRPDGTRVTTRELRLGGALVFSSSETRLPDGNRRGSWEMPERGLRKEYRVMGGASMEHEDATFTDSSSQSRVRRTTERDSRGVERSRIETTSVRGRQTTTADRTEVRRPDGTVRSSETASVDTRDAHGTPLKFTLSFRDGAPVGAQTTSTAFRKTDADLPGLNWVGWSVPQHLVAKLGHEDRIRSEDVSTTVDGKSLGVRKLIGENGHEVHQVDLAGGGRVWEYRVPGKDGRFDSQVFFQGSSTDTVVTRHATRDGWSESHTHASLPEQGERGKVPLDGHHWRREKADATMAEVRSLVGRTDRLGVLGSAPGLAAYREFEALAGEGRLKVEVDDSSADWADGRRTQDSRITVTTERGDRLMLARDPDTGALVARLQRSAPGADGVVDRLSLREKSGEVTEIHVDSSGKGAVQGIALDLLEGEKSDGLPEGVAPVDRHKSQHGVSTARSVVAGVGGGTGAGMKAWNWLGDPSRVTRSMGRLPGVHRQARIASGAAAVTGMMAMAADLGEGNLHAFVRDTGSTALSGSAMTRAMRWGATSKVLGAAGGALGIGSGLGTMMDGEYVSGGLETAAGAFSLYGAVGSGAWAGPVGMGVALACVAGQAGWEYHKDTRIAELRL